MNELISKRWSPRAFSADATVSDDELRTVLEAGRWAPSHGNSQPARFIAGHRGTETFDAIFETLTRGNRTWALRASVLLIGCVLTTDDRGDIPNVEFGLGLAMENMALQAVDLGLIAHMMGGFDKEAAHRTFAMPADVRPLVAMALGRHGDVSDLPEDLQAREQRERKRLPLSETVFTGTWGQSQFS
ncbi:nitroreductase family protein [Lentzea sp. BCCO 10_0798]|uniref:Nitroreductase family protein n=1 Tax=Lentzea kristufekii TaxID=3095430 RepID=A0ABU4TUE7_9PSEU|nr:nitroreductase family protein [Lentzea sp. BCCO 10_0798]MDX8051507.1 nitroreductase family protein [Lentzea sp. BCCO 10_0798]